MKRIGLSILMITLVFALSIGEAYATAVTATTPATGGVSIAAGTLARQNDAISFTTSTNVYVSYSVSASEENYTAGAGHFSGDKAFGMDSYGGPLYSSTKTAGASTFTTAIPNAADTSAATWTSWTAQ